MKMFHLKNSANWHKSEAVQKQSKIETFSQKICVNDRPYHIVLHFLKSKAEVWRVQQVEYNHQNNKYEDASQNNSLNQPEHQK